MFARCFTATAFMVGLLTSHIAYTNTVSTAKAELQSYTAQLAAVQAQFNQQTEELKTKQAASKLAASAPSPEKDKYLAAQLIVAELEAQAAVDPSRNSELKNAQFKLTLADRKLKKSNKVWQLLNSEAKVLAQQITASTTLISQLQNNISSQGQLITELEQQEISDEKKRQEQQLIEMENLKAENERLKARQFAEQETAAQKALQQQAAAQLVVAQATQVAKRAIALPDRSNRKTVTLLTNPVIIAGELERQSISAANRGSSQIGADKSLTIRIPNQTTRSAQLRALGGKQYSGEATLAFGKASFFIDGFFGKASIPSKMKNSRMTFLLDLSDENKPYLVFFIKPQ